MLSAELRQFSGTENYYRLGLAPARATDGIKFVADKCGAHWLFDICGIAQLFPKGDSSAGIKVSNGGPKRFQDFQVWRIRPGTDGKGCIVDCWNDTPDKSMILYSQSVPYTDFPFSEFEDQTFTWRYTQGVMLLESED